MIIYRSKNAFTRASSRAQVTEAEGKKRAVELSADAELYAAEQVAKARRIAADAEAYATQVVAQAIAEHGLSDQIVVVAHELTPHCRQALEEGTVDVVITQNVGHIVRSAVRVLRAKSDEAEINEGQEKIRIEIAIKENLS